MPIPRNDNAKFIALAVTPQGHLAETPCAICEGPAIVKLRRDGWIDVRCTDLNVCGYNEQALAKGSFMQIINAVTDNPKTVFRRTNKGLVQASLAPVIVENNMDNLEPEPIEPETLADEIEEPEIIADEAQDTGIDDAQADIEELLKNV